MGKSNGLGNTRGQSGGLGNGLSAEVVDALKVFNLEVQPEELYVIHKLGRELTFDNGTLIELHDNRPAIVVIVLSKAQAEGLPVGVTDVRQL